MIPGEYLSACFLQGKKLRVSTVLPPPSPADIAVQRYYILRDGEWVLDVEANFNE